MIKFRTPIRRDLGNEPGFYDLIPAVVVPSFLKTGLSLSRSENFAPYRIPSSTEMVTDFSSPDFGSTI